MKKCLHRLVRVKWIDADEDSGWQEMPKDHDPTWIIYSVGYLVSMPKRKTGFVVLANSHLPDVGQWSGISRIPKGMVLGIETLMSKIPCGTYEDTGNTRHPS